MINASDQPDGELAKEVYAHFGLCMYFAQVFETGLINILTALATASSAAPSGEMFDRLYSRHESLTFGNLMKELAAFEFLPADLEQEVRKLKLERDHLAHRFFRDHDLNFLTVGGCHVMIEELEARRKKFEALDKLVSVYQAKAFERVGFSSAAFESSCSRALTEMKIAARSRYSSNVPSHAESEAGGS